MLQTLDVLIGFAVVMLILSAMVTMLVQLVVTTMLNLKGVLLKDGVASLLLILDKGGLSVDETERIADHLLRNAMVGRRLMFQRRWRLAHVIHREELTKLIMDFAAGADLDKASKLAKDEPHDLEGEALLRARLLNSLRKNGIEKPAEILRAVRETMLKLEQARPEQASDLRLTEALLAHASSEFLAKLNAWFDQTIDRTIEEFTVRVRIWTVAFAAIVVAFFQVNSFDLIKRLTVDHETRQMLVTEAIQQPESFARLAKESQTPPADMTPTEALARISDNPELKRLMDDELITWPADGKAWVNYWMGTELKRGGGDNYALIARLIGVFLSVGLLSFGAPVWYEILKNLIQLRSLAARKDDAQRLARQTTQAI